MLLQGDLQKVFDALYHLGIIDPVLQMDWTEEFEEIENDPFSLAEIVNAVNASCGGYEQLMSDLQSFDLKDLSHLAMLVAKELVGFHTNKTVH